MYRFSLLHNSIEVQPFPTPIPTPPCFIISVLTVDFLGSYSSTVKLLISTQRPLGKSVHGLRVFFITFFRINIFFYRAASTITTWHFSSNQGKLGKRKQVSKRKLNQYWLAQQHHRPLFEWDGLIVRERIGSSWTRKASKNTWVIHLGHSCISGRNNKTKPLSLVPEITGFHLILLHITGTNEKFLSFISKKKTSYLDNSLHKHLYPKTELKCW